MVRTEIQPDRAALKLAHRFLKLIGDLDDLLKIPALCRAISRVAIERMWLREKVDVKKLQANDKDEP